MKKRLSLLCLALVCSCKPEAVIEDPSPTLPNILLIIADDMGKDATPGFAEGSDKPQTPHLDAIRNSGLTFSNFWSYPTCSPTRAAILTGKYGYRTGIKWANDSLTTSETLLPQYLSDATGGAYATAVVGKWHVSGDDNAPNPESYGMDYYAGLMRGGVTDYYQWRLYESGSQSRETGYTSTVFTDLAIDWVQAQAQPWFLWLAFNAPHTPFHLPPEGTHQQGSLPAYTTGMDPMPYYLAAMEAMDYEIGRLLDSLSEETRAHTIILFMGDNGTPNQVAQAPYTAQTVKGTLYQGGINVPLFVSGTGVSRTGTDANLISTTDLFATIVELAGASLPEIHDSRSFAGLLTQAGTHRSFQYSEMDNGSEDAWAISDGQYKLIEDAQGGQELYDLRSDPYETDDLLQGSLSAEAAAAKAALEAELGVIRD